jgi:hypothetical protein
VSGTEVAGVFIGESIPRGPQFSSFTSGAGVFSFGGILF